jgi:hypothetical protein
MYTHYEHHGAGEETWTTASTDHEEIYPEMPRLLSGAPILPQLHGDEYSGMHCSYEDINGGEFSATAWIPDNSSWQAFPHSSTLFSCESIQDLDWEPPSERTPLPTVEQTTSKSSTSAAKSLTIEAATLCRCEECGKKFKRQEHVRRHIGR